MNQTFTFADRLKSAMEQKHMKQVDLIHAAETAGVKVGKSHISQYVSGKTVPRAEILHFLSETLDVDADWLSGNGGNAVNLGTSPRRTFSKSTKLDNVLYDVRGPVVDEANRMERNGTHILKLNIGNPAPFGFRTPDEVIYDMRHQLADCQGYSASQGLFAARKAIMQYAQLKKIPNVDIDDIYTGNGVSELINLSMSALLDDGDEILIPSPDYPLWTACATLAGGKAVHYICDEQSEWYPDIEDMRKAAEFRGGKCLSPAMTKGDLSTPLDWECQFGHRFKASPTLVLLGGHWCPECLPLPWNYDEIAKGNPFFAQVWYPFHDKKEHNVYDESIFTDFKE